jgi:hypothetical protein
MINLSKEELDFLRGKMGQPTAPRNTGVQEIELRRQYTTDDGSVILFQAVVEVKENFASSWNPDTRRWESLSDIPAEIDPGAPLHRDDWGPGGYKEI